MIAASQVNFDTIGDAQHATLFRLTDEVAGIDDSLITGVTVLADVGVNEVPPRPHGAHVDSEGQEK